MGAGGLGPREPVHGTNGGLLYWDGERRQPFPAKWEGGYGAQVVVGEEYTLEGLSWAAGDLKDIIVEVSDPVGTAGEEEGIVLTLRTTDGREATCRPHAGESRRFHSSLGISAGAPLGVCGLAFHGLFAPLPTPTIHPTTPTTTTRPPPGTCDCGAEWDWRCHDPSTDPLGGLGCMGCGVQECRVCGGDPYPPCSSTTMGDTSTSTSMSGSSTTTSPPPGDCSSCPNSVWHHGCLDCSSDPWGCWGCNACGLLACR